MPIVNFKNIQIISIEIKLSDSPGSLLRSCGLSDFPAPNSFLIFSIFLYPFVKSRFRNFVSFYYLGSGHFFCENQLKDKINDLPGVNAFPESWQLCFFPVSGIAFNSRNGSIENKVLGIYSEKIVFQEFAPLLSVISFQLIFI